MGQEMRGQVAVVTGASSGIGAAVAQRFARAGAAVLMLDKNEAAGRELAANLLAVNHKVHFQTADVTVSTEVQTAMKRASDLFGTIDILVNSAGIDGPGDITDLPEEVWDSVIDTDLKSVYLTCKYALPYLIAQRSGVVLNLSSNAGLFPRAEDPAYSAAKAGVIALSRALAVSYAHLGIRVNAICPGPVDTPLLRRKVDQAPDPVEALAQLVAGCPAGRLASADEVAELCFYLASPKASFITGAALAIDGGKTAGRPLSA